jgi:hypothetical protein
MVKMVKPIFTMKNFHGQNGQSKFDHDNLYKFQIVFLLKFVEIVEISVNSGRDHLMIKWHCGHGQNGHF